MNFTTKKCATVSLGPWKSVVVVNSETVSLYTGFKFFLSSTFIYEPILINISMNANIMKTHSFIKQSMTSKVIEGHKR